LNLLIVLIDHFDCVLSGVD